MTEEQALKIIENMSLEEFEKLGQLIEALGEMKEIILKLKE